jgi:hypothetical protein
MLRFSHNPLEYEQGSIVSEWEYIKKAYDLKNDDLIKIGEFWYVNQ